MFHPSTGCDIAVLLNECALIMNKQTAIAIFVSILSINTQREVQKFSCLSYTNKQCYSHNHFLLALKLQTALTVFHHNVDVVLFIISEQFIQLTPLTWTSRLSLTPFEESLIHVLAS